MRSEAIRERLFLVDDKGTRSRARANLTGLEIETAEDGEAALGRCRRGPRPLRQAPAARGCTDVYNRPGGIA